MLASCAEGRDPDGGGNEPGEDIIVDSQTVLEIPLIDFIEMEATQPHENDPVIIWYDDFSSVKTYMDGFGDIDNVNFGKEGGGDPWIWDLIRELFMAMATEKLHLAITH